MKGRGCRAPLFGCPGHQCPGQDFGRHALAVRRGVAVQGESQSGVGVTEYLGGIARIDAGRQHLGGGEMPK